MKIDKLGLFGAVLGVLSLVGFGVTSCNDDAEASRHNEDLKRQAAEEQLQDAKSSANDEDSKWEAERAELEAKAARERAEEEANPHYDIVMRVSGVEREVDIYSHLTASEAKAKWLTLSTELEAGHKFFTVDDPKDLTATIMVRPDQIQYITINPYNQQ